MHDTSVAVELRTAIGDLQTGQEEEPAASCCLTLNSNVTHSNTATVKFECQQNVSTFIIGK